MNDDTEIAAAAPEVKADPRPRARSLEPQSKTPSTTTVRIIRPRVTWILRREKYRNIRPK